MSHCVIFEVFEEWPLLREISRTNRKTLVFATPRTYEDVPEDEIESGKWEILAWSCEPGDVIAFQGRTLHGAPGNLTFGPRRNLSTR